MPPMWCRSPKMSLPSWKRCRATPKATTFFLQRGAPVRSPVSAVDVGCFREAQAIGVDPHLHPADVVGHDEEDVGFLLLLRGCWCTRHHTHGEKRNQSEPLVSQDCHVQASSLHED